MQNIQSKTQVQRLPMDFQLVFQLFFASFLVGNFSICKYRLSASQILGKLCKSIWVIPKIDPYCVINQSQTLTPLSTHTRAADNRRAQPLTLGSCCTWTLERRSLRHSLVKCIGYGSVSFGNKSLNWDEAFDMRHRSHGHSEDTTRRPHAHKMKPAVLNAA